MEYPSPTFTAHSPMARPLRYLFQGDSITDAFRKPAEINPAFQLGNGYVFLIAAELDAQQPGQNDFINRGVSGNGVDDLQARWQEDTLDLAPDVLTILIGVNDAIRRVRCENSLSSAEFANIYNSLIDSAKSEQPNLRIILMEPFLVAAGQVDATWWREIKAVQKIVRQLSAKHGLPLIMLQKVFDDAVKRAPAEFWAYDGFHPTHAGFRLIAEAWLRHAPVHTGLCHAES